LTEKDTPVHSPEVFVVHPGAVALPRFTMTSDQLRLAHKAQPFAPFRVNLADGRSIPVLHPEYLAWNPGGRTVIIIQPDDSWSSVDLLLVTSLEFPAPERGAA
jgi:hypothetical protein